MPSADPAPRYRKVRIGTGRNRRTVRVAIVRKRARGGRPVPRSDREE